MTFKQQVRKFVETNRTVASVLESQSAKDDVVAAYVAGAKLGASKVERVGEILQQYTNGLPPNIVKELREIFEFNKEVVDG